jgi:hypothetical protein
MHKSIALVAALTCAGWPGLVHARFSPPSSPQSSPGADASDEVRLKSGGYLKGEIVEYLPGQYVVIIPRGSDQRREIAWSEVSEIVRAGVTEHSPTPPPQPEPEPQPQPQPQPVPEPKPVPELEVQEPPEPAAEEGMAVDMVVPDGKRPATLYHIDGEAVASGGRVVVRAIAFSEVCTSPCRETRLLESPGQFFVGGDKYTASKSFRLPMRADGYELRVKPRHVGMRIGGYVLVISSVMATSIMAAVPLAIDMPMSNARAMWAGSAVVGVLGIAGGITLMAFSTTKVEVLPRSK